MSLFTGFYTAGIISDMCRICGHAQRSHTYGVYCTPNSGLCPEGCGAALREGLPEALDWGVNPRGRPDAHNLCPGLPLHAQGDTCDHGVRLSVECQACDEEGGA